MSARPPEAWATITDVGRVASWLSIVRDVHEVEPMRRYTAVLEDRVGPFALRADLAIEVTADEAARQLGVRASGEDRQVASRISATVDLTVMEDRGGSVVRAAGRYEITGRIATLGAGAIRKKGDKVLEELFANIARELGAAGQLSGTSRKSEDPSRPA